MLQAAQAERIGRYTISRCPVVDCRLQCRRDAEVERSSRLASFGFRRHVGTPNRVTPHTARHSFITLELASGAEISVVSRLAGHASVTTTMRYRHLLDGEARRTVALLEPLIPPELRPHAVSSPVPVRGVTGETPPCLPHIERMTMPPANDTLDVQENFGDTAL